MSDIASIKDQGVIYLHRYQEGDPVLVNLAFAINFKRDYRQNPNDRTDLKQYQATHVKMMGESPLLVRETIEDIKEILNAAGVGVHNFQEKGASAKELTPYEKKESK